MTTVRQYREMAEECFGWAREAQTDEVRQCYYNLGQTWLEAACWIEVASRHCRQNKLSLVPQRHHKRKAA